MVMDTLPLVIPGETQQGMVGDTPQATDVAKSPEPTPSPIEAIQPVAPSGLDQQLRQQMETMQRQRETELTTREQRLRTQEDAGVLQTFQAQYAAQLEQKYGLVPEHAAEIAAQQAQLVYQSYQQQQAAEGHVRNIDAKVRVATRLAQTHDVPVHSLMQYDSPQEMEAAVGRIKAESAKDARMAAMEAELAKLKKSSVPPQSFAGAANAAPGTKSLQDLLKVDLRGKTPSELAAHEAEWDVALKRARQG